MPYTPGPWIANCFQVIAPKSRGPMSEIYGGRTVCHTGLGYGEGDESESNAKLIAAAPDLLAACRECLTVVDEAYQATVHSRVANTSEQRLRIEAAIKKATE